MKRRNNVYVRKILITSFDYIHRMELYIYVFIGMIRLNILLLIVLMDCNFHCG
jgi:hypothetical protein